MVLDLEFTRGGTYSGCFLRCREHRTLLYQLIPSLSRDEDYGDCGSWPKTGGRTFGTSSISSGIFYGSKIIFRHAEGYADIEKKVVPDTDTLYCIASPKLLQQPHALF